MRALALALALPLLFAAPVARAWVDGDAPDEATDVKDHPLVPRFPKSILIEGVARDFEEYALPVKYLEDASDFQTKTVEGRYVRLSYDNHAKATATEINRNYRAALEKAGFKVLLDYKGDSGRWLSAQQDLKGRSWVHVYTYVVNDWTHTELTVVEGKAMEQKIELDASAMLDELNRSGKVAVYGITFDTGKATITADSAKILGEIGKLLAGSAALRLRIEGHTDNVGKAATNLELSRKRAAAVKAWVVKEANVDAARLVTEGYGDARPVGDNKSEEGRAKNRRVELVKL